MKVAVLVAMADDFPFDQIHKIIHPRLVNFYAKFGFKTFFVYGNKLGRSEKILRSSLEALRWNKCAVFLRAFDKITLHSYKWRSPEVFRENDIIKVCVPDDIRHLSIKVIHSARLLMEQGFDFVIRTTASSILQPELLRQILNSFSDTDSIIYAGRRNDQPDGFSYISGSFTIWNKAAIELIYAHKNRIDYSLIDDVSIGKFFINHDIRPKSVKSIDISNIEAVEQLKTPSEIVHFRCKSALKFRNDEKLMSEILDLIEV